MPQFITIVRWTARGTAVIVAACYFLLVLNEILEPHSGPPQNFREWAGIALLTSAALGMLVACKWELPGALASLVAIAAFVPAVHMHRYDVIAVAAVPGVLFILDWMLRYFYHWPFERT